MVHVSIICRPERGKLNNLLHCGQKSGDGPALRSRIPSLNNVTSTGAGSNVGFGQEEEEGEEKEGMIDDVGPAVAMPTSDNVWSTLERGGPRGSLSLTHTMQCLLYHTHRKGDLVTTTVTATTTAPLATRASRTALL